MKLQEDQTRITLTRTGRDKWSVHIDGVRKPGVSMIEALDKVEELLRDEAKLQTIMIETVKPLP